MGLEITPDTISDNQELKSLLQRRMSLFNARDILKGVKRLFDVDFIKVEDCLIADSERKRFIRVPHFIKLRVVVLVGIAPLYFLAYNKVKL